jgi:RES domain-containing protein
VTPLPAALEPRAPLVAWRLDAARHAAAWASGIGAELAGGRWNPKGVRAVYASIDPATTILESAVHRGFDVLDTQPFVLTHFVVDDPAAVRVVGPDELPNPAWLHAGIPSAGQQAWGAALLAAHAFVVLPSVVSRASWNLVFDPARAAGRYALRGQQPLAPDTRLNPPRRA